MADLLADSDLEDNSGFTINKSYAEKYDKWRGKEELQKFTDRYGEAALQKLNNSSDSDSSSSSDEDDDAKEWTPNLEKQFFKTLSCLKKKDPRIYDTANKFFDKPQAEEPAVGKQEKKKKKEKPMFLRDYERKMILEKGGQISSEEDDETMIDRAPSPSFVQEQQSIKQSFKAVLSKDESDEEDIGGMFQHRQKSKAEMAREEEDYKEWLKGQKEELGNKEDASDLSCLKSYWNDPKLDESEAYLRDYILNRRYLEEKDEKYTPSYDEVVHDSDEEGLSGDERTLEQMEQFEHKYNFRFEEPDQEFIKRYPRTTQSSLRHKDDKRKTHREELKERKAQEKEAKRQQLKQLKAIKRKEIMERLEKLKQITGNTDVEFEGDDLNEDFDPEKHDKRMQELFDTDFYAGEEGDEKPEFPDLDEELELENWDQYDPAEGGGAAGDQSEGYEPHCEDPDFNMDCDYDPRAGLEQEMLAAQQPRGKKRRKRSKLAEILAKKKPQFDKSEHKVNKYMEEYYNLDFEDVIGDLPCRFKYRPVVANDYGLTIEEILMADDKELNRWCTLKKTCQYRSDNQEWYDVQAFKKKSNMEQLKRKILPSLFKHETQDEDQEDEERDKGESQKKKKKKKKNKKKSTNGTSTMETAENKKTPPPVEPTDVPAPPTKPKKEKTSASPKKSEMPKFIPLEPSPNLNKKKKKKQKKGAAAREVEQVAVPQPAVAAQKKRKRPSREMAAEQHGETQIKKFKKSSQSAKNLNRKSSSIQETTDISDSRLKAYGINPKKFKNKLKYGKK